MNGGGVPSTSPFSQQQPDAAKPASIADQIKNLRFMPGLSFPADLLANLWDPNTSQQDRTAIANSYWKWDAQANANNPSNAGGP
jgi:hypothetical protein